MQNVNRPNLTIIPFKKPVSKQTDAEKPIRLNIDNNLNKTDQTLAALKQKFMNNDQFSIMTFVPYGYFAFTKFSFNQAASSGNS